MIKIPYEELLAKIMAGSGLPQADIESKIKVKCDQLSGLISKEGAAHIVANELGVKLFERTSGKVALKDVHAGMRDLEVTGKVSAAYEVREFQGRNGPGKVGSFMLADESGAMRIVVWGTQADMVSSLTQGDILQIVGTYARENQGRKELHCNDRTQITKNPEGVSVDIDVSMMAAAPERAAATRVALKDLAEGQDNVEIMGAVVQIYDPRYWEACPQCNKRVRNQDGVFNCEQHGPVNPDYSYVMNCFIDDGTDNVRVVFFKNQAQRLTQKDHGAFLTYKDSPQMFEDVKHDLLGQMVKIKGRVQKNTMFDRLEFVSQIVEMPKAKEELQSQPS